MMKNEVNAENCQGVTVLPPKYFYPRPWMFANALFDKLTGDDWDSLFKDTYAVHFYASSSPTRKILRPKFYGKKVPAYSYLGVQHCPIRKILRPKFYGKKLPAYSYLGVQHCPI